MDKIILELCKRYHIKVINDTTISIIVSYISDLNDIEDTYDQLTLDTLYKSNGKNTVQGIFTFTK